jgi:hypothetical protein
MREYEEARREVLAAHDALMNNPSFTARLFARKTVSAAREMREECRVRLRLHEMNHGCAAVAVSVEWPKSRLEAHPRNH